MRLGYFPECHCAAVEKIDLKAFDNLAALIVPTIYMSGFPTLFCGGGESSSTTRTSDRSANSRNSRDFSLPCIVLFDAGIMRLRPVMITVGATVIALISLAMHGGPLWEPMCYAQIGLVAATFITLLLVLTCIN